MNAPAAAADKFHRAMLLYQQGRTAEAEALCRDIVRAQPRHAGALHILGVAAAQSGQPEEAIRLIRKSLAAEPNQHFAQVNLSAILLGLRRFDEALVACEAAIQLAPEMPLPHYNRGTALTELNRPLEAIVSLDRALQLKPDHVQALHNRGTLLARMGRLAEAVDSYDRALALMPQLLETLNNRGHALELLKRYPEALDSYERALRLKPDFIEALTSRGNVLRLLNRPQEALQGFEQALRLRPDFPDALNGRGRVLQALQQFEAALASYERALQSRPDLPESLNNRGSTLWELKRFDEALASFDKVLSVDPGHVDALLNRSNVLREIGRHEEALESCDRALRIRPNMAEALNVRGTVLLGLARAEEALESLDAALRLRPDYAEAVHNRGNTLRRLGRVEEALAALESSIHLGEHRPEALATCGWAFFECERYEKAVPYFVSVLASDPDSRYVLGALHYSRVMFCDWTDYQQTVERLAAAVQAGKCAAPPFALTAPVDAPELQLRCASTWIGDQFPAGRASAWTGQRYEHERIRVAYVSADFKQHVVSQLLAPLIERHDRQRLEVIGISLRPPDDSPVGQRIRGAFDRFHDVSALNDDQVAAQLCELEVDIVVDLGGFTGGQRSGIFARQGAPIQVTYLGYPGTIGAEYIHYLLADRTLIPETERSHYSESIVYLPECYQVNHAERPLPQAPPTRQECGLPEQGLVLCCFNNSFKITPPVFDVWMRLLHQLPESVLWLAAHRPSVVLNLRAAARERGIAPERLIFAEHRPRLEDHLVRYAVADLFLDTFPFNAHATASDALWYAVPVVTCMGRSFASRVAGSLLHTVGLPELITHSLHDYEAKVLELARNPARRAELRELLANTRRTHALYDTDRFRRHLESAYYTMWERQQRGEPPASFAVEALDV